MIKYIFIIFCFINSAMNTCISTVQNQNPTPEECFKRELDESDKTKGNEDSFCYVKVTHLSSPFCVPVKIDERENTFDKDYKDAYLKGCKSDEVDDSKGEPCQFIYSSKISSCYTRSFSNDEKEYYKADKCCYLAHEYVPMCMPLSNDVIEVYKESKAYPELSCHSKFIKFGLLFFYIIFNLL